MPGPSIEIYMRYDDHLPGAALQEGGLGDHVMLVQGVAVNIWDNFCLARMALDFLSGLSLAGTCACWLLCVKLRHVQVWV